MNRTLALACCLIGWSASIGLAQPLADRVPSNALLYVGWSGANSVGPGYAGSHLQSVLAESRVRELFGPYLDQLEAQIVKREPDAREPFRIVRTLGAPLWKYPSALIVTAVDQPAKGQSPVRLAVLTQAGPDAEKLAQEWTALIEKTPRTGRDASMGVRATASGDLVCLTLGYADEAIELGDATKSLATAPSFVSAVKQVAGASPTIVAYLDVEAAVALGEKAIAEQSSQPDSPEKKVTAFLDASGLRGIKRFVAASGFEGKDWVSQSFIEAPAPRTGLLSAWPDGSIDAAVLQAVPADSVFFATLRFDPAKFIRETQSALGKTDAEALKGFNMGLGAMQQALGTNVLENILEPLGPDWAFYNSPRVGTAGFLGIVMVNKPDDAEKLRRSLNAASVSLANWISVGIDHVDAVEDAGGSTGVRAQRTKIGDADVTYLTTPIVAPAWAISDGRLFVGLYPQTVGAAARQAKKGGPSITSSEKYAGVMKRLGADAPGSVSFNDLPGSVGFSQMYTTFLMAGRYAGIADLFGPPLPEPLMPPMDVLLDHLTPAGSASWSDAAGWHSKKVTPFPGAAILTEQGAVSSVGVGTTGVLTSILLPSLNRARETANRVESASNLKQIGLAMLLAANDNRGKYPDDLGVLLKTQDLVPEVFVSPRTTTELPPEARTDPAIAAQFVTTRSDYVYLGKGLKNTESAETILAYEKPDGLDDGINILYADGHVEFIFMDEALAEIEKQKTARGIK